MRGRTVRITAVMVAGSLTVGGLMVAANADSSVQVALRQKHDLQQRIEEIQETRRLRRVALHQRIRDPAEVHLHQRDLLLPRVEHDRPRARTGVDFTSYRDTTIRRRIMRRMALHSIPSATDYVDRLRQDSHEVDALYHDLLINVTSFFRDPEMFEALKTV